MSADQVAALTADAERYRALRRGMQVAVDEDGDLVLCAAVARRDEDGPFEEPMTEDSAPFLTPEERATVNGVSWAPSAAGYLTGDDVIDRIADHLIAALNAARQEARDA